MGIEICRALNNERLHLFFGALPIKTLRVLWLNQFFHQFYCVLAYTVIYCLGRISKTQQVGKTLTRLISKCHYVFSVQVSFLGSFIKL